MKGKDVKTKTYLEIPGHFADAFNYYIYDGKQVINSNDLIEKDPEELIDFGKKNGAVAVQRYRDILKECVIKQDGKTTYILLGIENQSELDYAMPVRNILYDALNYAEQVRRTGLKHRKSKDTGTSAEFLSGFTNEDRLVPVITLVIYWGKDEWDGPRNLSDMFTDIFPELEKFVNDYKINLITPYDITDFEKFKTELGTVFEIIKRSDDQDYMLEMSKVLDEKCVLSPTGIELVNELCETKFPIKEREDNNMAMAKGFVAVIEHGEEKHKIQLIFNKIKKGMDIATIAVHIEESEDYVRHIIELANQYTPNYDNANEIAYKLDEEKYGIKL